MKKSAMALSVPLVIVLLFSASSSLAMAPSGPVQWGKLDPHFYDQSRPHGRMASVLGKAHYQDPRMAASLLRLHFHDCFVKAGCDASLLLDSSGSMVSEKRSNHNKADEIIDEIKAAIEAACCPGTVSCADILALAARDSTEAAAAPVAVPAASVACSPLLQAPRKWLKGTTTLHIIGTGTGTSTAPSAPPPTPPERMQRPHTTKVPRWLITLISALSAILGVGGLVGYGVHYCCYNNRVEVYITISGTIKKIKLINRRWPRPVTCR